MTGTKLRAVTKDLVPPAIVRLLRRALRRAPDRTLFGEFATWGDARAASGGYDDASILERVRDSTLQVMRGDAVYERDSVVFDHIEYAWPVLSALMWAAARDGGRLHVLDFGGSLGTSYFQNRRFLGALHDVRWGVVEQPHYVACGNEMVTSGALAFFETVGACAAALPPNVALLSSVLQYVPRYEAVVDQVASAQPSVIVVDRTIVNRSGRDRIHVQTVPPSIYAASYPCRSISEQALFRCFEQSGYALVSDFDCPPFPALDAIGSLFKGYVFTRELPR